MALIECDKCNEKVSEMAAQCPYCGNTINPVTNDNDYICDNCGAPIKENDNSCWECGAEFTDDDGNEEIKEEETTDKKNTKNKSNCVVDNIDYTSSENFYNKISTVAWFFVGGFVGFILWLFIFGFRTGGDDSTIMSTFLFMIGGGALLCSIISASSNSSNLTKRNEFLQQCQDKINKIIDGDESYVSLTADVKGISINKKDKTVTVYNGLSAKPIKLKYEDILSFELIEDGSQEIQGKGAETYLAGRYLGANAALAVASSSRNINQFCNQLLIEIHKSDVQEKNITIEIINNVNVNKISEDYKKLKTFSKNIITTLDKVMREIDSENSKDKKDKKEAKSNKLDIPSQLREYKKLLDDGIITEKDFNDKKEELLKKKDD